MKYATAATLKRFGAAIDKLVAARLFHNDIHVAILPDGSLKFYDNDLAAPMTLLGLSLLGSSVQGDDQTRPFLLRSGRWFS